MDTHVSGTQADDKVSTKVDKNAQASSNSNVMAAVATIPLVGAVMYFTMKDLDANVKHYAKQSIGLTILSAISIGLFVVGTILTVVFIGLFILCLNAIFGIVIFVLWVLLVVNALQGNMYTLPVISGFVDSLVKD